MTVLAASPLRLDASVLDYAILALYFLVVLGIGAVARLSIKTDLDFFLSGRSLPAWVTGLAFVAANLGALEILGMAANGAQYGVATVRFYWIGAVPAMVFLGLAMMPFYYGAKVRSVPEYLRLRFVNAAHAWNAGSFAIATVLISGVNLFALALVINLLLGWSIATAIVVAAFVVLAYITPGRADVRDLQRGPALLHHPGEPHPADARRAARHGRAERAGRPRREVQARSGRAARVAGRRRRQRHEPDRRQLDRDRLRPGLRALVRLLDDEVRRGPARAVGAQPVRRAAHAADRRLSEDDLHPGGDGHPGSRRTRVGARPRRLRPGPAVQQRDPHPHGALPPRGPPRARGHAAAGGVHGRRRRERDVVQHGVHVRHLAVVRPQEPRPGVLPAGRADRHGRRDRGVGAHGVHRQGLLEHHELRPAAVLVLQRAAVRDVHHRHVLAALDAAGGRAGHDRRLPRRLHHPPPVLQGPAGAGLRARRELLGSHHRLRRRRRRHGRRVARRAAQARGGAARAGLGSHPHGGGPRGAPRPARPAVVALPGAARRRRAGPHRDREHRLHLGAGSCPSSRCPSAESAAGTTAVSPATRRPPRARPTFDIRRIIGAVFLVYGAILVVVGILGSTDVKTKAAGVNIDLWTGLAMLVVGGLMIAWALLRPVEPEAPEAPRSGARAVLRRRESQTRAVRGRTFTVR